MRRIPTLDGWRALAIAAVVVHHIGRGFYSNEDAYASDVTRYGAFGVDIFFGISGLLITKLLLDEWSRRDSFDLPGFYLRRAFRILPPYLTYLLVCTIAGLWRSPWEAAGCLLFFRNYVPDHLAGDSTQHLWSLAVEEHFYLLWPGLLFLLKPRRARSAAFILACAFGLWRMIESQLATRTLLSIPSHFRTDLRLDALLWGCVFAFLLNDAAQREKLTAQLRWPVWLALACVFALCVALYSPLSSVWIACVIPMLLLGTITHPQWMFSRFLDWAPIAWLGRISYSLYLWQQLFLIAGWQHPAHAPFLYALTRWPLNLFACLATAAASYYLIEKPLIRVGRGLADRFSKPLEKKSYELASLPVETLAE
jgi:peptidoglycan/LPS O-acetylase OafA/YrhL